MESISNNHLSRFTITEKRVYKEQVLSDEIWNYFGKRIAFSLIRKMILEKGDKFIYETFQEVKKSDARNPLSLFIWKVNQCKILWK